MSSFLLDKQKQSAKAYVDGDRDIDPKSGLTGVGGTGVHQRASFYAWFRKRGGMTEEQGKFLDRYEAANGEVKPPVYRKIDSDTTHMHLHNGDIIPFDSSRKTFYDNFKINPR